MKASTLHIILLLSCINGFSQATLEYDAIEQFGNQIAATISNNSPSFLNRHFDYSAFLISISEKSGIEFPKENPSFIEGLEKTLLPGNKIENDLEGTGEMSLIYVKSGSNIRLLTFRLINPHGMNYFDMIVTKSNTGYLVADIYNYSNYEFLSDHYTKYLQLYLSSNSIKSNKPEKTQAKKENVKAQLSSKISKGKFQSALNTFNKLPSDLKLDREILILGIKAASFCDVSETERLIETYKTCNFPVGNKIVLLPIEGFFTLGAYSEALKYIDLLDAEVGDDPYLNFYRGRIQQSSGNHEKAAWLFEKMIDDLPENQEGYFGLIEVLISMENYSTATEVLKQVVYKFGYYKEDLDNILQGYNGFYKSEAYQAWKED